jgi:UDP-3-O-acyl-N-acetylglucosamine deacetylase
VFIFSVSFACVLAGILLGLWLGDHADQVSHTQIATQITELRSYMATTTERIQAALDATNAALDNIVTDIAALKAKVEAGAPSEDVLFALDALSARAEAVAQSTPDEGN